MCLSIKIKRPDSVLAEGEHAGFQWVVTHNGMGYRCGYIRIPAGHPWHGRDYSDVPADCHGGLTFAEADVPCDAPGTDDAWWLGFDCAHAGDAPDPELPSAGMQDPFFNPWAMGLLSDELVIGGGCTLRTQDYAERECTRLCDQAAQVA